MSSGGGGCRSSGRSSRRGSRGRRSRRGRNGRNRRGGRYGSGGRAIHGRGSGGGIHGGRIHIRRGSHKGSGTAGTAANFLNFNIVSCAVYVHDKPTHHFIKSS